ncbi:hypothetical protein E2C01_064860 [Portunus trituberculatus]|uniref:Uncharacterized protein n=1 Tax=Portunus trituberculatus TaxID=210409 RepID=A0A5B7HKZ5_PORTR|nr:hypothetical protein [Portunus trituberculatus]
MPHNLTLSSSPSSLKCLAIGRTKH